MRRTRDVHETNSAQTYHKIDLQDLTQDPWLYQTPSHTDACPCALSAPDVAGQPASAALLAAALSLSKKAQSPPSEGTQQRQHWLAWLAVVHACVLSPRAVAVAWERTSCWCLPSWGPLG